MSDSFQMDLNQVFKGIDFASEKIAEASVRGMEKAMEDLKAEAVQRAPKLTGELRSSAKVELKRTGYSVTGEVVFSVIKTNKRGWGYNIALRLHEMPIKNPTTPGTGPKYLSQPLKRNSNHYREVMAQEIAKELT